MTRKKSTKVESYTRHARDDKITSSD